MANIPLQYPFPYKTINSTGFTSSVEFVNVTVLGDVTIDQNLTVSGNITTTDLTVGDDLTVGGQIDAQVLRAFGVWDTPIQTVNGAGAWIGFDGSGHTIFANRKSTAGQTNSWRWYAFDHTNAFQGELMRLSNAGNLFISGTRIEFPLIHFQQPPGTFPQYDFILPSSMGGAGQVLTSAGAGNPTYWTTPSGGGGGGGTVTNVTGTSPISVTSPTTTPNISLGTIPTTLGGTGLTTIGTNGQVLSSNGTNLQYVTLPTPVTSVAATSPLASSGGTTPTISIASSTGTGSVVLNNGPTFDTQFYLDSPGTNDGYLKILSVANANYIQSALQPTTGSTADFKFTDYNAANTWMTIAAGGNVGIGTTSPGTKFVVEGAPASFGIQYLSSTATLSTTINTVDILHRWYESTGNASYIDLSWIRTSAGGSWDSAGQRFQAKTDTSFQGYVQFNGDNNHGLSFGTGISHTAHGVAERMRIDGSGNVGILGNVGIGTTTPAYSLDVNVPGIPQFAVREMFNGGFRTQWNYSGGQGETTIFTYRGGGSGGFWFKNLNTSNADVGFATITCGSIYSDGNVDITKPGTGVTAEINISAGTVGSPSVANQATLNFGTVGGGGGFVNQWIQAAYNATDGYHLSINSNQTVVIPSGPLRIPNGIVQAIDEPEVIPTNTDYTIIRTYGGVGLYGFKGASNNQLDLRFASASTFGTPTVGMTLKSDGNVGIGTTAPAQKLHVDGSTFITGSLGIGISTPSTRLYIDGGSATMYDSNNVGFQYRNDNRRYTIGIRGDTSNVFAITDDTAAAFRMVIDTSGNVGIGTTTPSSKLQVNGTTRATNFTTNGTNTFTYASGTFTPRIAMFYTSDNKVYECNNPPAGKDPIAISYSVQTGVWVRVGNLITINMEIQYSQTYSGVTFDVSNLNIVAVIPEDACKPNTLGAVGVTGYPSRIADRFVDNFQMNYWISNTSYAPGGTICEVQLRRDNTHNMMPWDPTNKGGQRVNITTSYYVLQ